MGASYYNILGRQIGSHHLAMATLGSIFAASYFSMSGGSKKQAPAAPPINASSSDELDFIKKFMEQDEKKAAPAAKH
ncbi:hypothetical protein B0H66DRAFT_603614 [Apodospora peruviana]|uniref:ATP synthase subunit K, mitochondrial n=1 Tax=Apodospora peruviana TaxID=516989 RepID=A0AAE0I5V0_9PEZI|nr:hypothetical protein B0H66DRAFT_603614 [Apodospora peruviana]